jgi:hypothetical protein
MAAVAGLRVDQGVIPETPVRQRAKAGEQKSLLAREFGISRETVYQYIRSER